MIGKQDILDRASEWRLRPDVVEKDYVLGWLLAALAQHPVTRELWVFKGGTCIKKCYVETYRFSEDLDFSMMAAAPYTADEISQTLVEATKQASEMSGIHFPEETIEVRPRQNKQGQPTFQGRVAYGGPLRQLNNLTPPRVLFDLTRQEPILDAPHPRPVFHPYPDLLPEDVHVLAYSINELLAEKTRALYERTRPRDLYDVVYLFDNPPGSLDLDQVHHLFSRKCEVRSLSRPTQAQLLQLARGDEELRSEWSSMLAHQLPDLPDLGPVLRRLSSQLAWIERPVEVPAEPMRAVVPLSAGETSIPLAGIQYWGTGVPLETIRFAGANRLLVEFVYQGRMRVVEPYSLRRAGIGNLLVYGWEIASQHIKAFNVAEIQGLRSTHTTFTPRYQIELAHIAHGAGQNAATGFNKASTTD